jgi:hypothetical protein
MHDGSITIVFQNRTDREGVTGYDGQGGEGFRGHCDGQDVLRFMKSVQT